jgi:Na+/H+ antiporter
MLVFETILALLLGAALLSMFARKSGVPYPTLLAVAGVGLALVPGLPTLDFPPDLILALFVAPILLDAAHDMSLRDLRRNWRPVLSLVVVAVGLTTAAVAITARWFLPDMPWGAAIALGALLAPPDAVAALAVMKQVEPPHRVRTVLEGESLLNDASSLLAYKLAVSSVAVGGFSAGEATPAFALVAFGSVTVGWCLAKVVARLLHRVEDAAIATVLQFVATFGIWLLAERLHLSGVITIVTFGLTAARAPTSSMPTAVRVSSFATWETVTFVLNVLAFLLVGLQLRPLLSAIEGGQTMAWLGHSFVILVVVVVVRFCWVFVYRALFRDDPSRPDAMSREASLKAALVVGWSGMRGIVTLAAALALPVGFPYRDFIFLTAFVVVLATLVLQGLTLRPLLQWLKMPRDTVVDSEVELARATALKAALTGLERHEGAATLRLKQEYEAVLQGTAFGNDLNEATGNVLRREIVLHARKAIDALRDGGQIGDDAYRRVEQELDWLELSSQS